MVKKIYTYGFHELFLKQIENLQVVTILKSGNKLWEKIYGIFIELLCMMMKGDHFK